jgi:hypothetical protein
MTQRIKHEITFKPDSAHKKIAILDDDKDVTTTFRTILESDLVSRGEIAFKFIVYTSNNPAQFLNPDFTICCSLTSICQGWMDLK